MNLTKMTGKLDEDFKQIVHLNSRNDRDKIVILNDRFVCKYKEDYRGDGVYYYLSESYRLSSCKKHISNDIELIVFDKVAQREFYATWIISRDMDLSHVFSSFLYERNVGKVVDMFTVVKYEFKDKSEFEHDWEISCRVVE